MRRVFPARFFTPRQSGFKMRSHVPDTALELIATAELFAVAGRHGGARSPRDDLLFFTATRNCSPHITAAIVLARTTRFVTTPWGCNYKTSREARSRTLFG